MDGFTLFADGDMGPKGFWETAWFILAVASGASAGLFLVSALVLAVVRLVGGVTVPGARKAFHAVAAAACLSGAVYLVLLALLEKDPLVWTGAVVLTASVVPFFLSARRPAKVRPAARHPVDPHGA